eukprot:3190118-Prymnesium_polylepis.1
MAALQRQQAVTAAELTQSMAAERARVNAGCTRATAPRLPVPTALGRSAANGLPRLRGKPDCPIYDAF